MRRRSLLPSVVALAALTFGRPVPAAAGDPSSEFATAEAAAFAEADADGDGKLTPDEFASFGALLRQKLDALHFARLDANGDGVVGRDELAAGRPLPPPPF